MNNSDLTLLGEVIEIFIEDANAVPQDTSVMFVAANITFQ